MPSQKTAKHKVGCSLFHNELQTAAAGLEEVNRSVDFALTDAVQSSHVSELEKHKVLQQSSKRRKTYSFSSTEGNLTRRNAATADVVYVCVCVYLCVFSSVTAPHGDDCVMWITWQCWHSGRFRWKD